MTKAIEQICNQVRALAAAYPDATYEAGTNELDDGRLCESECRYTSGTALPCPSTGCLIGQAISAAFPVLFPSLEAVDNQSITVGAAGLLVQLGLCEDKHGNGASWLNSVQTSQDIGKSWAKAVELADEEWPQA